MVVRVRVKVVGVMEKVMAEGVVVIEVKVRW